MTLASAVSAGAAGVTAVRWGLRPRDRLGSPRGFPVWSVSLLVLLCLATAVPALRQRALEHRLAGVAGQLVGSRVTVHCQSLSGALVDAGADLGHVRFDADGVPEHRTLVKREQCQDLRHYTHHWHHPRLADVVAVHVLTHESMHMRGETSEAAAECEAVQRDALTAAALGASAAQARLLAREYWRAVYPDMPEDYRSDECHAGGRLDEHLASAPWVSG